MNSVFSSFDDLHKSHGALRDLTESLMQKNLRLFEICHEIRGEEFVAKIRKPQKSSKIVSYSGRIYRFRRKILCFSTFDILEKSLGPLRDLTESSMQNNLRFNKN